MGNSIFIAALLVSMIHVVSGPDHLAAVTPFAISKNKKSWLVGFLWGLGHVLGMLMIGVLFYFFKSLIPVEKISIYSEKIVAIVLIGVGIVSFYRIFNEKKKQEYPHFHEDEIHIHKHNEGHTHKQQIKQYSFSTFGIGFIHGLAGVAHILMLMPVLSFSENSDSLLYIIGFSTGTILSMTAYSFVIGKISSLVKNKNKDIFNKGLRFLGALFAFSIGIYWLVLSF